MEESFLWYKRMWWFQEVRLHSWWNLSTHLFILVYPLELPFHYTLRFIFRKVKVCKPWFFPYWEKNQKGGYNKWKSVTWQYTNNSNAGYIKLNGWECSPLILFSVLMYVYVCKCPGNVFQLVQLKRQTYCNKYYGYRKFRYSANEELNIQENNI